jgi:NAD(P)-dependent dehydrogenase (short-subunit alcohol dehydrogenase family)
MMGDVSVMSTHRSADLRGHTVLITGATSGLGRETAAALAAAGSDLIVVARDPDLGAQTASELRADSGVSVHLGTADLSDPASVAAFARYAKRELPRLSVLIANAGVSITPNAHQANGWDTRFATNHLGHFLLAQLLLGHFDGPASRLVVLSSAAHKGRPVRLDDLNWHSRPRDDLAAYGESKTANILFAREATRRWSSLGVTANAVLPGAVLTGLQRYHGDELLQRIGLVGADGTPHSSVRTVEQGAATSVWAAVAPELDGRGGLVLEDCAVAKPWVAGDDPWSGYDPTVLDDETARLLWTQSETLLAPYLSKGTS